MTCLLGVIRTLRGKPKQFKNDNSFVTKLNTKSEHQQDICCVTHYCCIIIVSYDYRMFSMAKSRSILLVIESINVTVYFNKTLQIDPRLNYHIAVPFKGCIILSM